MVIERLRTFSKTLPSLFIAFLLAIAVWVMAINSSDPSVEKVYPNQVSIEIVGQSPDTVINTDLSENVAITLRAPSSIWNTLLVEKAPVRAFIDLAGLSVGPHTVPVQIQVGTKPVEIISYNPRSITLEIEPLLTQNMDIRVIYQGSLPVGFQSEDPVLSQTSVIVSGAESTVKSVAEVRAVVKLTDVKAAIHQSIQLVAVNSNGQPVSGVSISPEKVDYNQNVAERGGYRNVVVKVVTAGLVPSGYKLTSLSVFPPTITVFATDPLLVDALPGYVETYPIDLNGKTSDFEQRITLNLPFSVQAIEAEQVSVNVGIAPIESSITLEDVQVEATGLPTSKLATIQPSKVTVVISGPVIVLQALKASDVRVLLDLTGMGTGKFTVEPNVTLNIPGLNISSLIPTTFVIEIR
jgi:YbbR domain-containing protein